MTEPEKKKAEELIASIEISIGEITPRGDGNATLIKDMIQSVNGLRTLLCLSKSLH